MKLLVTRGWNGDEQVVSENTGEMDISDLFDSLTWTEFNSVTLEINSKNWLNVSGNVKEDGLAIVYEENGIQFFSEEAPSSVEEIRRVLLQFLEGNDSYKTLGFLSGESSANDNQEAFEKWKEGYYQIQASNKRRRKISVLIVGAILLIGAIIAVLL